MLNLILSKCVDGLGRLRRDASLKSRDPMAIGVELAELHLFQYLPPPNISRDLHKMMNTGNNAPTNATQTKERLYAQLALSLGRMSRAVSQTADLCEQLQVDLHAMRILGGLDAAKYVLLRFSLILLLFL